MQPGFWQSELGPAAPRPPLPGDLEVDVAIVGAGFTGLWTAYHLLRAEPSLRVVVLEREQVGFGASGRNGGWLSALLPGPRSRYGAGAEALGEAMRQQVLDVEKTCAEEGIDADLVRGGTLTVATTGAQEQRLRAHVAAEQTSDPDLVLLGPDQCDVRVAGLRVGAFTPHCARLQPAKLVRGLAAAAERRGAVIHEGTAVSAIAPREVTTDRGTVRARWVVRATEGFTAGLPGQRRTWLPMNSSMIATDPLPQAFWDDVGWENRTTLADEAHVYCYAQRTAGDRIAIGGRGVPYRYASRTDHGGETARATVAELESTLARLFPQLAGTKAAAAWSGVLGVSRDWCATVGADPATGLAWAGGYAGDGVTTSALAGRTLADLITGRSTDLTCLPWVGRAPKRWEPEPLRWLGVRTAYAAYRFADRVETTRTSPVAKIADRLTGQ
jgi:glycine/D-amino acid oxidase-like deaminating enzyme